MVQVVSSPTWSELCLSPSQMPACPRPDPGWLCRVERPVVGAGRHRDSPLPPYTQAQQCHTWTQASFTSLFTLWPGERYPPSLKGCPTAIIRAPKGPVSAEPWGRILRGGAQDGFLGATPATRRTEPEPERNPVPRGPPRPLTPSPAVFDPLPRGQDASLLRAA